MDKIKVVVIAGPTATGKSGLAIELATAFGGEVVSADSMQVYRHMDIGTAKPGSHDRARVPHHMIDIRDPDEDFSAAQFRVEGKEAVEAIDLRGATAFITGGTGLYIRALTRGIFEGPGPDLELRADLERKAEAEGPEAVFKELVALDPICAKQIHPNNLKRVIRAIEICRLSGRPVSELHVEHGFGAEDFEVLRVALTKERDELYRSIDDRVDRMLSSGLLEETRTLIEMGYSTELKSMQALGYKEMCRYLSGGSTLDEATSMLKKNTRNYAKRQITWFGNEDGYKWFNAGGKADIMREVRSFLD